MADLASGIDPSFTEGQENPLAVAPVTQEFIANFFQQKGVPAEYAQAWAHRMMLESGGNPLAVNPTSGALGLAQDLGPRKTNLLSLPGWQNPDVQLNNVWNEMHGGDPIATQHFGQMETGGYAGGYQGFTHWFERPGVQGGDVLAEGGTTHAGSNATPPDLSSVGKPIEAGTTQPGASPVQVVLPPMEAGPQKLNSMQIMQLVNAMTQGTHKFTPVDYDPWKYAPGKPAMPSYSLGGVGGV